LRKAAFALVLTAAIGAVSTTALAKPRRATAGLRLYPDPAVVVKQINLYRSTTWRWQHVMGIDVTPAVAKRPVRPGVEYELRVLDFWRLRAQIIRRLALNPPHKSQWLCIHRYEADWSDSGGLYYGGLQMDLAFQRHYGGYLLARKGTAEHWSPLEQMWVAEHAYRSGRGYYPWPHTARACGLI
jgi:hypothetical protein